MENRFNFRIKNLGLADPPPHFFEVTPDDGNDLPEMVRGLLLENAGDVKVATAEGDTIILPLQPGYNPGFFSRVYLTDTDVAGIGKIRGYC